MRLHVVCAFLLLSSSCVGHAQDAHEPGDRLGTFHASGKLVTDTCQATVLGVTSAWQFDVKLSRDANTLYWLNGQEAIPGTIASNGKSFGFQSGVEVLLQAPQGVRPGCVIVRSDTASGKLSSSSTDVKSFDVDMSFGYAVKSGSECAGFVGVEGGFASLPCAVSYSLSAERTALPPSLD
jgi:hypothetical protein